MSDAPFSNHKVASPTRSLKQSCMYGASEDDVQHILSINWAAVSNQTVVYAQKPEENVRSSKGRLMDALVSSLAGRMMHVTPVDYHQLAAIN